MKNQSSIEISSQFQDLSNPLEKEKLLNRIQIEHSFNSVRYKNVGLGDIIGYNFKRFSNFTLSPFSLKKLFRQLISLLLKIRLRRVQIEADVLFIHYSERHKDWSILDGVEKKIEPPVKVARISAAKMTLRYIPIDLFRWSKFWFVNYFKVKEQIRNLLLKNSLDTNLTKQLLTYFIISSLYFENLLVLLYRVTPKLMLFTYDRDQYSSIVAACSNALGLKTATIIHGSSFHLPTGYLPALTDDILIWGQQHVDCFLSYGVSDNRLHIVGFPNLKRLDYSGTEVRIRYGIPLDKKIALFASDKKPISSFYEEFRDLADWVPVIKPHPTSPPSFEIEIQENFPEAIILPVKCSVEDAMAIANVVIGLKSTLLIEALSMQKPVIIFNSLLEKEEGIGAYLYKYGKAPYISKQGDLHKILSNENLEYLLNSSLQFEYFNVLCAYRGSDSEDKIVSYIKNNI